MSFFKNRKVLFINFAVITISIFAAVVSSCGSPLGFGKQVDFEAPVLTLIPKPPSPMYVKYGAQLAGTVTDNEAVDRVILRDSANNDNVLFTANLLPDDRWQIDLNFSPEQNGEKITVDIVAYDKAGNSDADSIATVDLIIDITPPIVEDIWIQRNSVRTADLMPYTDLKLLETDDPKGKLSKNVDLYQNGAFYIKAKISEEDTSIKSLTLKIYDSEYPDTELLSLAPDDGSTNYNPQWLLTEKDILKAGIAKIPKPDYETNYYNNVNQRYYYRVRVVATDKSDNDSVEEQDYFCLWNEADYPKGILDSRAVGTDGDDIIVTKGSMLPVEFFDDDKIEWAYAGLFTKEQWAGKNEIAPGIKFTGADDDEKIANLQDLLLRDKKTIYNWRYDSDREKKPSDSEPLENYIPNPIDEKLQYLGTGNEPTDFGDFVLVTLIKDLKQAPHNNDKIETTKYPDVVRYKKYNVTLIDENAPLIVFDKEHGSPEENTFPALDGDGKFVIHGYTLREDKTIQDDGSGGQNKVDKFRLAWIPFGISGGAEEAISKVKDALAGVIKNGVPVTCPEGVQWWDLSADIQNPSNNTTEKIGGSPFRKQYFRKTFSILGEEDDIKGEYDNFTMIKGNKTTFENTTKLFVFYAEDNMGHIVYSQFYLLGNRTPPTIDIYDITDRLVMSSPPVPNVYEYSPTGAITPAYIKDRDDFNESSYDKIKETIPPNESGLSPTEAYRAYPRGTIIKFWVKAQKEGDLSIKTIKMEDITFKDATTPLGYFNDTDHALSYVEYFPEVSQRVFRFTATDSLGNIATVQRTIAIASAATLTSITTTEQNGTYPKDKVIEIRANFDSLIILQKHDSGTRPRLNVLYNIDGSGYGVQQIECEDVITPALFLTFKFKVPENAKGMLETIYLGTPNKPGSNPAVFPPTTAFAEINRPITIISGNNIIDAVRGDSAYTPGNVTGFVWKDATHSLQYDATLNPTGKTINLDGVVPKITGFTISKAKTPGSTSPNKYYFKSGESLSIELTASKPLKISGETALSFTLTKPSIDGGGSTTANTNAFDYRTVLGNTITYTLDVNSTSIGVNHGQLNINDLSITNAAGITDDAGNPIDTSTISTYRSTLNSGNEIYFDLKAPEPPISVLTAFGGGNDPPPYTLTPKSTSTINYSKTPYLGINEYDPDHEPYGKVKRQYSLNGGLRWADFPNEDMEWGATETGGNIYIPNGQWTVKTRYIDSAGNEGAATEQLIYVNSAFPKLIGVKAVQPNGTYSTGQTLQFTLDFDDVVNAAAGDLSNIAIVLKNTNAVDDTPGGVSPSYKTIAINPSSAFANNSTVTFSWTLAENTKDMPDGLALDSVRIDGLKDKFGNYGPKTGTEPTVISTSALSNTSITLINGTAVTYNLSGIKVSTIKPTTRSREPQNAKNRTGNINSYSTEPGDQYEMVTPTAFASGSISLDNQTIKLNFSKDIQKGNGTITIRPHAGYAIPAVFTNDEFAAVFNNCSNTDKESLVGSTSMSDPALVPETGLSAGPYLKTTHGLKQGAGFSGNYSNAGNYYAGLGADQGPATNNEADAPGARGTDYMVPDLSLKWVLRYNIDNIFDTTANSVVTKIRTALDNTKFRWQEIAVTDSIVTISEKTVTIVLRDTLPDGLRWDLYYDEGTFTDKAGNKAAGVARGDYWFWSKGVQKPVIRVDRKSYDARPNGNYKGDSYSNGSTYQAVGYAGSITSYNTVNYIITSETPQARISAGQIIGTNYSGSITAAWSGQVTQTTDTNFSNNTAITWNGPKATTGTLPTTGTWVRPNLIFRHGSSGNYNYLKEPTITIARVLGAGQNYYGFRSYNKDASYTDLFTTLAITDTTTSYSTFVTGNFTYSSLQASKNYVAAIARIDHKNTAANETNTYSSKDYESGRGVEGVFRTVVVMYQSSRTGANGPASGTAWSDANHPMMIFGTDARSGTPTIPGFPLKDGVHRNDSRFLKVFYRGQNNAADFNTPTNGLYWVTTEMVTQWYLQLCGHGGTPQNNSAGSYSRSGDVEDWVSAGYGDLSYALDLATW